MWAWVRRLTRREVTGDDHTPGSYVMEAEWERSEELRPDRLGPSEFDVVDPEMYQVPDRPVRTLGPLRRH